MLPVPLVVIAESLVDRSKEVKSKRSTEAAITDDPDILLPHLNDQLLVSSRGEHRSV
jgi:hypothetical protein